MIIRHLSHCLNACAAPLGVLLHGPRGLPLDPRKDRIYTRTARKEAWTLRIQESTAYRCWWRKASRPSWGSQLQIAALLRVPKPRSCWLKSPLRPEETMSGP